MEKVIIEIIDPSVNSAEKFTKGVEALAKATRMHYHFEESGSSEPSPYLSLMELDRELKEMVSRGLTMILHEIMRTWIGTAAHKAMENEPYKLNGQIFINPKTGRPLTIKEWKIIAKDLEKVFGYLYGHTEEMLTKKALALGKILQTMSVEKRISTPLDSLDLTRYLRELSADEKFQQMLDYSRIRTGELIQEVTARQRRNIVNEILTATEKKLTAKQLEERLFDQFSEYNRDWRRIAETETGMNFNNGFLLGEAASRGVGEIIYMKGLSAPDACSFCLNEINNKIVVLLDEDPGTGDDHIVVDGKEYETLWAGKTNFQRKRKDWWVSISQHPHCLTGENIVSADHITGASKRWYVGDIITIKTSNNKTIRCTPNHPILSREGFIAANAFNVGDEIGCISGTEFMSGGDDENIQKPAFIKDIVDSFLESTKVSTKEMKVAPEDFHGDGKGSKVAVIGANGFLRDDFNLDFPQHFHQSNFMFGDVKTRILHSLCALTFLVKRHWFSTFSKVGFFKGLNTLWRHFYSLCSFNFSGEWHRSSSCSEMSLSNLMLSLVFRHLRPLQDFSFALSSDMNFRVSQSQANGTATYFELMRKFVFGDSRIIQRDDLIYRKRILYEFPVNISKSIMFESITHIEVLPFEGYVYNIETESSYYIANGIVNHNCRCTWVRWYPEMAKYDKMLQDALAEQAKRFAKV